MLENTIDPRSVPKKQRQTQSNTILELRNHFWAKERRIPQWVDVSNVGLDQFFTRPAIAEHCWNSFCNYLQADNANISDYCFIEPSAGMGSFYRLLPQNNRIGIDIETFNHEYIESDFLAWSPKKNNTKYVCIGNPPFGYRAWLALLFLNHAAQFSEYVGFILPMGFQSIGKSNLISRVKGLHLVHSSPLPHDSFVDRHGKSVKVNALWQIWARNSNGKQLTAQTCNQYIDLFTVDMRKERLCGQKRIHEADFFLQRTFYTTPPDIVKTFDQVKYCCGYGIVIKQKKQQIIDTLQSTDWRNYSNLASHNCRHISMCHIQKAITDVGFVDV